MGRQLQRKTRRLRHKTDQPDHAVHDDAVDREESARQGAKRLDDPALIDLVEPELVLQDVGERGVLRGQALGGGAVLEVHQVRHVNPQQRNRAADEHDHVM